MKKLFSLCMLGLMSVGVAACVASTEPAEESKNAPELEPQGICAVGWTCDDITYYSTKAACNTATSCDGGCYRDYNCNGRCTCP